MKSHDAPDVLPRASVNQMYSQNGKVDVRGQSLLKEIAGAFPTKIPKAVQAILATPSPQLETTEIRALLSGKDWRSLSDDIYMSGCPSIFVVGSGALEYYLPGLMSAAIRNPGAGLDDRLVESFRPPFDAKDFARFAARFVGFTGEQKTVVAHFMEWYRDSYSEDSAKIADRIDRAIHRYWLPPK